MALFNDKNAKQFRKLLRNNPTYAERALWNGLRGNQRGAKFRRQESVGPYVLDFYCPELRLAVEVDGVTHEHRKEYDRARDTVLQNWHVTTLRFRDEEVLSDTERVLHDISSVIASMRSDGRSVRKPSAILSKDERARRAAGVPQRPAPSPLLKKEVEQPPPSPLLKKEGVS